MPDNDAPQYGPLPDSPNRTMDIPETRKFLVSGFLRPLEDRHEADVTEVPVG